MKTTKEIMDLIESNQEGIKLKGIYKITKSRITDEYRELYNKIEKMLKNGENAIEWIRRFNELCKVEEYVIENIIPTVARTMIANNLASSSPTNTMLINYSALGTGSTAVANGDTTLDTEVYRKVTASYTNADNIAYVTAFYTATEDDDTYYEAGLFSDASASADSGVLFSRVLLNAPTGITKSNTETLTIDYTITIS